LPLEKVVFYKKGGFLRIIVSLQLLNRDN